MNKFVAFTLYAVFMVGATADSLFRAKANAKHLSFVSQPRALQILRVVTALDLAGRGFIIRG